MRYAKINELDVTNGKGLGISIFVQGCDLHCKGCFNQETWDFNGGKEFTNEILNEILELLNKPYITRLTILGGEPLAKENVEGVLLIVQMVKEIFPDKKIWLYTGRTIHGEFYKITEDEEINLISTLEESKYYDENDPEIFLKNLDFLSKQLSVLTYVDYIVDGRYIESQRDLTLAFRGSTNQRIIDVKETLKNKEITLLKE